MKYLLDTNVVCEVTGKNPEPRVLQWMDAHAHESVLSSATLGEIWKGIHRLPEGKRKRALIRWVEGLEGDFIEQCVGFDTPTFKIWGRLYATNEAKGLQLDVMDSLIASQAIEHSLIIATRNTTDFPKEVKTTNPWKP